MLSCHLHKFTTNVEWSTWYDNRRKPDQKQQTRLLREHLIIQLGCKPTFLADFVTRAPRTGHRPITQDKRRRRTETRPTIRSAPTFYLRLTSRAELSNAENKPDRLHSVTECASSDLNHSHKRESAHARTQRQNPQFETAPVSAFRASSFVRLKINDPYGIPAYTDGVAYVPDTAA